MEKWTGEERRRNTGDFCSQHISMTNDIVEIKTILLGIEKSLTHGVTFKTAMVGSIVLIVLTLIGQGVLYGRVIEKVDNLKTIQIDVISLQKMQAEDRNQIQVNTERWNRLLERNPVVIENKK